MHQVMDIGAKKCLSFYLIGIMIPDYLSQIRLSWLLKIEQDVH